MPSEPKKLSPRRSDRLKTVFSQFNNAFALMTVIPILICFYLFSAKFVSMEMFIGLHGIYFVLAITLALLGLLLGRQQLRGVVEELFASNALSDRLLGQLERANEQIKEELGRRDEAERALRQSEQKFRRIFRESLDVILVIAYDSWRIIEANRAARRILGYDAVSLVGKHCRIIFPNSSHTEVEALLDGLRREGSLYLSQEFLRADGSRCPMDMTATVIPWENGRAVLASFRDASERRRIDRIKDEFVSTVSHELRTPLSVMRESVSQIYEGYCGALSPDQKEMLRLALSGMDRLGRLVGDLLNLSRLEAGKLVLNRAKVDLKVLVEEVAENMRRRADSRNINLVCRVPAEPLPVYVDADKISNVFTNLIGNALKFTKEGKIEIDVRAEAQQIVCCVSDTGPGIASEDLRHVFEKFQQFDHETAGGERGTGLGLAICKGFVERHRGTIRVASELGRGTAFTFTLPRYSERQVMLEFINDHLGTAQREGVPVAVFHVRIDRGPVAEPPLDQVLATVRRAIRRKLPHRIGAVIQTQSGLLGVMQGVNAEDAMGAGETLREVCKESLTEEEAGGPYTLQWRAAGFPENGANDRELLQHLEKEESHA